MNSVTELNVFHFSNNLSVFQGEGNIEYVIEAPDHEQMMSWLGALRKVIQPDGGQADEASASLM